MPDLCCGRQCGQSTFCEPTTGSCQGTCIGKTCGAGQACIGGECVADKCGGKSCGELELCDQRSGDCVQNACGSVMCVPGFTCCRGLCQQDLCALIRCPANYRCTTNPLDCSHSCDTIIVPEALQDRVVGAGGGGFTLGCAVGPRRGRAGEGAGTSMALALVGIAIGLRRRWRCRQRCQRR